MAQLSLISWNVASRVTRLAEQIAFLAGQAPDLVALQEVRAHTVPVWRAGLREAGLPYTVDSFALAADPTRLTGSRRYGELLAARWPLTPLDPGEFPVPWPERVLSAMLAGPWGEIEVHTAHIPCGASHGMLKVETIEGIYRRLARPAGCLRILCGDLNTPQAETPDGQIATWGQDLAPDGAPLPPPPAWERWDSAERSVLAGLAAFDLPDAFRAVNGYGVADYSWFLWRKGRCIARRRFDHIFAAPVLNAAMCRYIQVPREQGLSDHAPIAAHFRPDCPAGQRST